jgi:hypothetical protein
MIGLDQQFVVAKAASYRNNRAIELNSSLQEPYMYRGVLHVQMGNKEFALEDHQKLIALGSERAAELEYVVIEVREKEPEQFFGVSRRID